MDILIKKKAGQERAAEDKSAAGRAVPTGDPDACRCKEVSRMSLSSLLKLMMKDLSTWKRRRK